MAFDAPMHTTPRLIAPLVACLLSACSGAQPARPNLPPPEYEEPGGVVSGVAPLAPAAGPSDAGGAPMAPATTP
jgi:hypothetical protein